MATHDYVIDNASGSAVRTDLNNVFQAILTNNSSGSAPSTTAAYMLWADTSNNILKMRNSADNAWINLFTLSGGVDVDAASNFAAAVTFTEDVTFTGASANIVFDKSTDDLIFNDNAKAIFGTSSDGLKIFHDGSGSFITDSGTGDLHIRSSDDLKLETADGSETYLVCNQNSSVDLYFDNAKKAETVTGGFTVTGTCTATTFSGSGASLTNLPAANLTGTLPAIDGSNLTGVGGGVTSDSQSNTTAGSGAGDSFSGTDAEENTLFGKDCGENITTGDNNTAMGRAALHDNQTKSNNTAIGHNCLNKCIQNNSTAVGSSAGASLTTGTYFTAVGAYAMDAVTTGSSMTAIGYNALGQAVDGTANSALGHEALRYATSGSNLTAIGNKALEQVTTASNQTAVGSGAARYVTTATNITCVGYNAGHAKQTGDSLTAVGNSCLRQATGNNNTAVGNNAGYGITTGQNNTAVGHYTQMLNNPTDNTMVGHFAGYNTSGNQNTGIGQGALNACSGNNNTCLGVGANPSSSTSGNQVTLGNSSINNLRCADTSISSLSDRRDKTDIIDLPVGLDFINKVRAVRFKWQTREGVATKDGTIRGGFIAQELQDVMTDFDASWLDLVQDENPEKLEAKQGKLLPVMVKAIQELSAKVTALEAG